jgi:hypothetical protein
VREIGPGFGRVLSRSGLNVAASDYGYAMTVSVTVRMSTPPTPSRLCQAQTFMTGVNAWGDRPAIEAHHAPCRAGASAWVTEVDYCWGHMPAEWRIVAERRHELWAEHAPQLWAEICIEIPGP